MGISVFNRDEEAELFRRMSVTSSNHHHIEVPVLIVGGGPSGLLQAYLLSRLGGAILERYRITFRRILTDSRSEMFGN
jgi:ribulose 1,5-bisphosphate synthetase/thiazole synthase